MDRDEEMDASPLTQPFFTTDKERGVGNDDKEDRQAEDRDGRQDEDPGSPVEEEEEDEDTDVCIIRRFSARIQTKERARTNGPQHSDSEESSEDEDMDDEEKVAGKALKHFPASSLSQTVTS